MPFVWDSFITYFGEEYLRDKPLSVVLEAYHRYAVDTSGPEASARAVFEAHASPPVNG